MRISDRSADVCSSDLNYGRSTTQGRERVLVQQNFENALNAVLDPSGNIVCAPGYQNAPIETLSSTCAPTSPSGQQISQAARDYVKIGRTSCRERVCQYV